MSLVLIHLLKVIAGPNSSEKNKKIIKSPTFRQYSKISTLSWRHVALWSKSVVHLPSALMYWLWYSRFRLSPCFSGQIIATIGSWCWLVGFPGWKIIIKKIQLFSQNFSGFGDIYNEISNNCPTIITGGRKAWLLQIWFMKKKLIISRLKSQGTLQK